MWARLALAGCLLAADPTISSIAEDEGADREVEGGGGDERESIRCTEIVLPLHDLLYIAKGPALLDVQPHDFWPKLLPGLRHFGKQDTGGEQQGEGRRAKEVRSQDNNGFRKRRRRRIKLEAGIQMLAGNYRNKDLMRNSASSEATGRQVVV
jgi:hypothetical protein